MNYVTSNFFEFKGYQVQKIKKTEQSITVFLSPRRKTAICPNCETKSKSLFSKDGNRRLKHSKYESRIVELSLPRRRFYCKRCSKPFAETPEFANPKARTTKNFALEAVHALSKSSLS